MAKFSLIPFDLDHSPPLNFSVELNQSDDSVFISYRITEGFHHIDRGDLTPHKSRVMKLWEKTCFELFIKNGAGSYLEFNFSPNFEWNCFYFKNKGDPLKEWEKMKTPKLDILLSHEHFLLFAEIKKDLFPVDFNNQKNEWKFGISSVIKSTEQKMSYWALIHCDSRPNFHHFDSFIGTF